MQHGTPVIVTSVLLHTVVTHKLEAEDLQKTVVRNVISGLFTQPDPS